MVALRFLEMDSSFLYPGVRENYAFLFPFSYWIQTPERMALQKIILLIRINELPSFLYDE